MVPCHRGPSAFRRLSAANSASASPPRHSRGLTRHTLHAMISQSGKTLMTVPVSAPPTAASADVLESLGVLPVVSTQPKLRRNTASLNDLKSLLDDLGREQVEGAETPTAVDVSDAKMQQPVFGSPVVTTAADLDQLSIGSTTQAIGNAPLAPRPEWMLECGLLDSAKRHYTRRRYPSGSASAPVTPTPPRRGVPSGPINIVPLGTVPTPVPRKSPPAMPTIPDSPADFPGSVAEEEAAQMLSKSSLTGPQSQTAPPPSPTAPKRSFVQVPTGPLAEPVKPRAGP